MIVTACGASPAAQPAPTSPATAAAQPAGPSEPTGAVDDTGSAAPAAGGSSEPPSHCRLPEAAGPCEAYFPRFRFDSRTGACVQFIYGGCQGNANNFDTKEACESACKR